MQRIYTLKELASFLNRTQKELRKLAENDVLHGRKVQGEWLFALPDIVQWMDRQMTKVDDEKKRHFEKALESAAEDHEEVDFRELLSPNLVELNFTAKTQPSVILRLVKIAEDAGALWDPESMAEDLREREKMASTALENGVAILHPRRPRPDIIADDFLVVAIASNGVPFGGGFGNLTDVFFLLCSHSDVFHLRAIGRLASVVRKPGVLDKLRAATSPNDVVELLAKEAESFD
jgi:PTS system nitrogen regulatory IIA component